MSIQQNLEHILSRIRAAELRAGRPAGSVRLVAVSKTFPAEDVKACHDAGQRIFGENKVQEGLAKIPSLPPDTEWHLIGPLQRNKVRKALEYFTLIHAVDSLRLARFMDTVAQETGKRPRILLEVNVGNEDSKSRILPGNPGKGMAGAVLPEPS
ncbi:MAG: YggS family pyridoxal phosphate-dependent enzyme [Akkermansia muciniphila]